MALCIFMTVWSLYILPVSAGVSSGCLGFLPQSKVMEFKLIGNFGNFGNSKSLIGVNCIVVCFFWSYQL